MKGLETHMSHLNISLESTCPNMKGSSSVAETSIRLLKRAMKKMCLYNPAAWPSQLPFVLDALNDSVLYNSTSRNKIYFSPIHYSNKLSLLGFQDFPLDLFNKQWRLLEHVRNKQASNLLLHLLQIYRSLK